MKHLEEILTKIRDELIRTGETRTDDPYEQIPPGVDRNAPEQEFSIRHPDDWHKLLFALVCRSHGLRTYRKPIDASQISHVKTTKPIFDHVIWPGFMQHGAVVERLVKRLMDELIQDTYPDLDELTIGFGDM